MTRTASCACGDLQIVVEGDPTIVAACNCTQCQKRTGSVFGVGAYFPDAQVLEKKGESKSFERSSDAGRKLNSHFCVNCGSTVYWEIEFIEEHTGVAVGCFADPDFPEPSFVVWSATKHDWVSFPDHYLVSNNQDFDQHRGDD